MKRALLVWWGPFGVLAVHDLGSTQCSGPLALLQRTQLPQLLINGSVNCLKIARYCWINKTHIKKNEVSNEVGVILSMSCLVTTVTGS